MLLNKGTFFVHIVIGKYLKRHSFLASLNKTQKRLKTTCKLGGKSEMGKMEIFPGCSSKHPSHSCWVSALYTRVAWISGGTPWQGPPSKGALGKALRSKGFKRWAKTHRARRFTKARSLCKCGKGWELVEKWEKRRMLGGGWWPRISGGTVPCPLLPPSLPLLTCFTTKISPKIRDAHCSIWQYISCKNVCLCICQKNKNNSSSITAIQNDMHIWEKGPGQTLPSVTIYQPTCAI